MFSSGGFFAGKVKSIRESVERGTRFDAEAGAMGVMYRARYLKDGFFQALPILKEVAVSCYSMHDPLTIQTEAFVGQTQSQTD